MEERMQSGLLDVSQSQLQSEVNPGNNLWASILASTGHSRGQVRGKSRDRDKERRGRLVVLGNNNAGKRTLIAALDGSNDKSSSNNKVVINNASPSILGLHFQSIQLGDGQGIEDDLPSLTSLYSISDPFSPLLSLALSSHSSHNPQDALVLILLDWEKPWTFLAVLRDWLGALILWEKQVSSENNTDALHNTSRQHILDEGRKQLEAIIRSYSEPIVKEGLSTNTQPYPILSSALNSTVTYDDHLPLPQGCLTTNLGIGIIVVLTKSDHIATLERTGQLSEDQIDYIQQTVRSVCLSYGAALFSTSIHHPSSCTQLRRYLSHRLSVSSMSSTSQSTLTTSTSATLTSPFPYRANVVDRERLVIPSGWDSIGKILVLSDGFDAETWMEGWRGDIAETTLAEGRDPVGGERSALEDYGRVIIDREAQAVPISTTSLLEIQNEQDFLRLHYEILVREASKRERVTGSATSGIQTHASHERNASTASGPTVSNEAAAQVAARFFDSPGVVGPMANASLFLPDVERALNRDGTTTQSTHPSMDRKESYRGLLPAKLDGTSGLLPAPLSPSPNPVGLVTPTGSNGAPQNEVLANFFKGLLSARSERVSSDALGSIPVSHRKGPAGNISTTTHKVEHQESTGSQM